MTPDLHTTVLLETMAGKGSEIGGKFEELRAIIDLAACGEMALALAPRGLRTKHWKVLASMASAAFPIL